MGTFHHDKSELHGITIVVETEAGEVCIGRCDDMDGERILLLDADVHHEDGDGTSRERYLERAEKFGVWPQFPRLVIPRAAVTAVWRLGGGTAAEAD